MINGTLRSVASGTSSGTYSITIDDTDEINIDGCSGMNYELNPQCLLIKIEGFATTLTNGFTDTGTEPLSMRTDVHDLHSYDIIILNNELYQVETEPSEKTNITVRRYPDARTASEKSSSIGDTLRRVATRATTIKKISGNPAIIQFHESGEYDRHGFSRGDVISIINVQGTDVFDGKLFVVGDTNRTSLAINDD